MNNTLNDPRTSPDLYAILHQCSRLVINVMQGNDSLCDVACKNALRMHLKFKICGQNALYGFLSYIYIILYS